MKYILPIVLLLISSQRLLLAQRIGLSSGYVYARHEATDQAIQYFNFSHPTHGTHSFLRNGFYFSFDYSHDIRKKVLFISTRVSYWQVQSSTNSYVYPIRSTTQGTNLSVGLNWYLLAEGSNLGNPSSFIRNFFTSFNLGAAYMTHSISDENRVFLLEGETHQPTSVAAFTNIGIGYDIFTLPIFSFTPEVRIGYMMPFTFANLSQVYTSASSSFEEISATQRIYFEAGLTIRLHLLQTTYR